MNAIPLVRASILFPWLSFLNQIGSPTERFLSQAKLSIAIRQEPESLLSLYQSIIFLENAAKFEGIATLGIVVGQRTPIHELGAFGRVLCNSLTLFDLLVTIERTINMVNSGQRFSLRWEKDWVWLQHHCLGPAHVENLQSQRYSLMLFINALRMALGPTWQPPEIHLEGAPCPEILAMGEFSAVCIHFQCPQNAIKIPRALLSLPLKPAANPHDLALQPDYEALQGLAPAQDFVGSLKQLIRALLPQGYPDITFVADVSGMSVRSYQRKLAAACLSHSQLVDQVRFELAVNLLEQPEVQLIQIAADLGYADPANFTRAFKRWTGVSPREFRQLHQ